MVIKSTKIAAACFLAFSGVVSAYTITGSVSDDQGTAIKGASVSLLKEGKIAACLLAGGMGTRGGGRPAGFHRYGDSIVFFQFRRVH